MSWNVVSPPIGSHLVDLGQVDPANAHDVLTRHLAILMRRALEAVSGRDAKSLKRQVAVADGIAKVIEQLVSDAVATMINYGEAGDLLMAVARGRKPTGEFDNPRVLASAPPARPDLQPGQLVTAPPGVLAGLLEVWTTVLDDRRRFRSTVAIPLSLALAERLVEALLALDPARKGLPSTSGEDESRGRILGVAYGDQPADGGDLNAVAAVVSAVAALAPDCSRHVWGIHTQHFLAIRGPAPPYG